MIINGHRRSLHICLYLRTHTFVKTLNSPRCGGDWTLGWRLDNYLRKRGLYFPLRHVLQDIGFLVPQTELGRDEENSRPLTPELPCVGAWAQLSPREQDPPSAQGRPLPAHLLSFGQLTCRPRSQSYTSTLMVL